MYASEQQAALLEAARLMREGAKLRPQAFNVFYSPVPSRNGEQGGSCALGAIYEAKTESTHIDEERDPDLGFFAFDELKELSALDVLSVHDPVITLTASLEYVISRLNDYEGWSRERIADWLESLATS